MSYKEQLEQFIKEHGNFGNICDECIAKRKELFQAGRKGLKFVEGDYVKFGLPQVDTENEEGFEYCWFELMDVNDQSKPIGRLDNDTVYTKEKFDDLVEIDPNECIDFISKDWDEETAYKHMFNVLSSLGHENHGE